MTTHDAVEVRGLVHRYGERTALAGIDLAVKPGEVFALLGPNGGGKSTLFRILATLLAPSAGEAIVLGHDVRRSPRTVRQQIGVLFQSPSVDKKLTVEENLRHHGHLYGMRGAALTKRIDESLEKIKLSERRRERVETLSGGLMRRVEIAKSLVHSPQLLLLDEPGTGLDPGARRALREQLEDLRQSWGVTCLLTTHLMDEADTCDRVGILDHGRLVALDSPAALKRAIHGDVVTVTADRPRELRDTIRTRFHTEAQLMGDSLRMECERGHELAAKLAEAFPQRISAVSVSRPTLDDVFLKHTGHRLDEDVAGGRETRRQGEGETRRQGERKTAPDLKSPCLPGSLSPPLSHFSLPTASLAWREVVRFVRQPSRVLGGLGTPILFWVLLGSGLGQSFHPPGSVRSAGYLAYSFTGTVVMVILFTAIFSTISVIQDRAEGFLQSVLASPAWRSSIVAGKVLGATMLAMMQAVLFLLLAPTIGLVVTPGQALAILGVLFLLSLALSALGFAVAWRMDSTQGFHAVMNLFLIPMWLLSGALFPASGAPSWLRGVMAVNPLTYGVALLRHTLEAGGVRSDETLPAAGLSLLVTMAFASAMMAFSTWRACRPAR